MSWYQKGKTNLDFTEARDSGISWAICKSAPSLQAGNHASTPPLSFFTDQMPFLLPNQQRQSTEGIIFYITENTHTHTHTFNGPFSGTTRLGQQWCSGAGTHRNAVPVNILGPEWRSGSYPSSQSERYCCSVPANVCRQDRICLF